MVISAMRYMVFTLSRNSSVAFFSAKKSGMSPAMSMGDTNREMSVSSVLLKSISSHEALVVLVNFLMTGMTILRHITLAIYTMSVIAAVDTSQYIHSREYSAMPIEFNQLSMVGFILYIY